MNSYRKYINIWEIGEKINVKVHTKFIDHLNLKIKEKYQTKRKVHKELIKSYTIPFGTFKKRIKRGYSYFVDLEIFIILCKLLKIPLKKFQNNIIAYKTRRGHNFIKNPKIPVEITPIFDMLFAHHIGDGTVVDPKNGRKPYFSYRQYNQKYKKLYVKKIESVFGEIEYKNEYFKEPTNTRVYFPVVASELFFNLYNYDEKGFLSLTTRIPKEIFNKSPEHKLAFLIGIIIDEGNIDSNLVVINMKNKKIIEDLKKICEDLSYPSTLRPRKEEGFYCLYILSNGTKKLYQDYLKLKEKHPEVDLGYKGRKIKEFINRINKPKIYLPGNKEKILEMLKEELLTVNELASRLNMTRQGARYLINGLIKEGKVEFKMKEKRNYYYGLRK